MGGLKRTAQLFSEKEQISGAIHGAKGLGGQIFLLI